MTAEALIDGGEVARPENDFVADSSTSPEPAPALEPDGSLSGKASQAGGGHGDELDQLLAQWDREAAPAAEHRQAEPQPAPDDFRERLQQVYVNGVVERERRIAAEQAYAQGIQAAREAAETQREIEAVASE